MGLFKRINDIISANLGEVADQYEDPEKMLKQAVREMEESIETTTGEAAKTVAGEKRLKQELRSNERNANLWQERAQQAVTANDDELARKALSRKIEHEKLVRALEDQLRSVSEATTTIRRQLDGMKAKLAEAKRNLATLTARKRAADIRKNAFIASGARQETRIHDNAFKKFDRMREKVEMAEAEAEALEELRGEVPASENRFEMDSEDSVDLDVEAELAKMKEDAGER